MITYYDHQTLRGLSQLPFSYPTIAEVNEQAVERWDAAF